MNRTDDDGLKLYFEERSKLNDLLLHEEIYWKQRARTLWLTEGDENMNFFHANASARRRTNHIPYLINENGMKVDNHDEMCNIVKEYFTWVFTRNARPRNDQNSYSDNRVSDAQNEKLVAK